MDAPRPADSAGGVADAHAGPAVELADALRAKARAAATAALRHGLEEIELRHGIHVADEVAGLIDIADVFAGLYGEHNGSGGNEGDSFEFTSYKV